MTDRSANQLDGRGHGFRRGAAPLALALTVLGALLIAGPLGARPGVLPAGNLVKNPGAEDSAAAPYNNVVPAAGWTTTASFTVRPYAPKEGDLPTRAVAATIGGGLNLFSGGPGGIAGTPTASQSIDVSGAATEIDAGAVAATLSAFMGGYAASEDLARVDAIFYDDTGKKLGGLHVGPVTPAARKNVTTLLKRSAVANVPKTTRRIDVVISVAVDHNGANDAFVDNVSLTLGKAAAPTSGKATLTTACSGKTLVATVRPAAGSAARSVTFLVNGKVVAIDKKAPFAAHIRTAGLPVHLKVTARVQFADKTIALTKAVTRC